MHSFPLETPAFVLLFDEFCPPAYWHTHCTANYLLNAANVGHKAPVKYRAKLLTSVSTRVRLYKRKEHHFQRIVESLVVLTENICFSVNSQLFPSLHFLCGIHLIYQCGKKSAPPSRLFSTVMKVFTADVIDWSGPRVKVLALQHITFPS